MMQAEDEKQVNELNSLLEQRVTVLEEQMKVVTIRQDEHEEELKDLKYDFKYLKRIVHDERSSRMLQTTGVTFAIFVFLGGVWALL